MQQVSFFLVFCFLLLVGCSGPQSLKPLTTYGEGPFSPEELEVFVERASDLSELIVEDLNEKQKMYDEQIASSKTSEQEEEATISATEVVRYSKFVALQQLYLLRLKTNKADISEYGEFLYHNKCYPLVDSTVIRRLNASLSEEDMAKAYKIAKVVEEGEKIKDRLPSVSKDLRQPSEIPVIFAR